jgi:hypothetical protein
MRPRHLLFALAIGGLAAGCLPVPSLHPLVAPGEAIEVPGLAGDWADDSDLFRFTDEGERLYTLSVRDSTGEMRPFYSLRFVRLEGRLFADAQVAPAAVPDELDAPLLLRSHLLLRADLAADSLLLSFLDDTWLDEALARRAVKARHERTDGGLVLTEPTRGLRSLVVRCARESAAFDTLNRLRRVR